MDMLFHYHTEENRPIVCDLLEMVYNVLGGYNRTNREPFIIRITTHPLDSVRRNNICCREK